MPQTHVPVLAGELIEALDPRAGQIAVDCTLGGARSRAPRRRAHRPDRNADRDRPRPDRRGHVRRSSPPRSPCETRFIRADFVSGLAQLIDEGVRADLVYMDLGMSSMQVDNRERGFAYAYDAPLDMRMDPDQELTAREIVNTWDRRRIARALREYGEERFADRIAGEIVRRRGRAGADHDLRAQRGDHRRHPRARPLRRRPPGQAHVPGDPHRGQRRAAAARRGAPARPGASLKVGGRVAALTFHSLEDRRVKRFFAEKARGCICPPDLPVCVCGNTPEAELVHRRSIVPTPGEIAANPRSKSARLRAARKLREER